MDNMNLVDDIVKSIDDMMILSERMFEEKSRSNSKMYIKHKEEYDEARHKLRESLASLVSKLS